LEIEDTSPQISCSALFSEQLCEIDQAIKEFDILNEEKEGKERHVVYSQRVSASHGGPQMEHSLNLGPKRRLEAHITLERSGGATNIADGPINFPALPKETMSP